MALFRYRTFGIRCENNSTSGLLIEEIQYKCKLEIKQCNGLKCSNCHSGQWVMWVSSADLVSILHAIIDYTAYSAEHIVKVDKDGLKI